MTSYAPVTPEVASDTLMWPRIEVDEDLGSSVSRIFGNAGRADDCAHSCEAGGANLKSVNPVDRSLAASRIVRYLCGLLTETTSSFLFTSLPP